MSEPELQPDERMAVRAGIPVVVHERRGEPDQPLVVFIPGAVHLARIGYGHTGSRPDDFVAHWFEQLGWSFIAFSYPLELLSPTFDEVDPDVGLARFASAVAQLADEAATSWGLGTEVVVLGWSAAGNIAPRLNQELTGLGRILSLFVSLAATPPIPDLIFGSLDDSRAWAEAPTSFTDSGLLAHSGIRSFAVELEWTDARYQRAVIPTEVYEHSYVGNMPLNIFPGLGVRREKGRLVVGHDGPLTESLGTTWNSYPMVADLQPTWALDERHAVTDKSNWSMVLTNMLSRRWTPEDARALSPGDWSALIEAVNTAPDRLHRQIEGGHMFFVGDEGARQTVEATVEFRAAAAELTQLLGSLLRSI
jgi:hypothetical protein